MFKSCLIILFSFLLFSSGYSQSLHFILVGDTTSNIAPQVTKDIGFMQGRGKALASELEIPYHLSVLTGEYATREAVLSFLDSQTFDPTDIVVFYFTGHGCRTDKKQTQWPYLMFSQNNGYLALDEIVHRLYAVNPQFSLVIADCCNNYLDRKPPHADPSTFNFWHPMHHSFHPRAIDLFKNSKGLLVISGAEPGGYSWASDQGGILTAAFFDALGFRSNSTVNWNEVLHFIHHYTWHIQKVQMAHYTH